MRRLTLLTVLALLTSCGAIRFDLEQPIAEQKVPGSLLGGVLPNLFPNPFKLTIDVRAETEKRGTGPATAAFLTSLDLNATPADNPSGTFDFLDEVHVFVEAPGQPKVEVATLKPVPKGQTSVSFSIVPNVNLLPYVNAGATMSTTATGRQPAKDFTFDGKAVFEVRI